MCNSKICLKMAGTDINDINVVHKYIYELGKYQKMSDESVSISKETLKKQL